MADADPASAALEADELDVVELEAIELEAIELEATELDAEVEVLGAVVRLDEVEVGAVVLELGWSAAAVLELSEPEAVGALATARPWSGALLQAAIKMPIATTPADRTNRISTPIE